MDPTTSAIYWIEGRPAEGGRDVIVDASKGQDVFGREWNARTGVQEVQPSDAIPSSYVLNCTAVRRRSCNSIRRSGLLLQLR